LQELHSSKGIFYESIKGLLFHYFLGDRDRCLLSYLSKDVKYPCAKQDKPTNETCARTD